MGFTGAFPCSSFRQRQRVGLQRDEVVFPVPVICMPKHLSDCRTVSPRSKGPGQLVPRCFGETQGKLTLSLLPSSLGTLPGSPSHFSGYIYQ